MLCGFIAIYWTGLWTMGGVRHCSTCKVTHEGTTGKKCLLSTQTDGITNMSESPPVNSEQQISSDQTLATASQIMIRNDSQSTSQSQIKS